MTEQHVPVDRLAAYAAGDLDATAALDVEAHVLLCADCRAEVDAVNRATAALASLGPVTMPADVAARIEAALAEEAAAPSAPVGDVVPMLPKRRRPSFAGLAAVAAGLALVVAIGVPLVNRAGEDPTATLADGAPESVETRRFESGLNYTNDDIPNVLQLALKGTTADRNSAYSGGAPAPAYEASARPSAQATAQDTTAVSGGNAPLSLKMLESDAARLAACVAALAESQPSSLGRTPLLLDFARYEGREALVVVFPTVLKGELRADRVDVWVVGARCGITPGDDDVYTFTRIPRPQGL
jgi:hypothetical protein